MTAAELTPWTLRFAYENACFPMDDREYPGEDLQWFRPVRRCLLPIDGIHVSRSLAKTIRRGDYEIRFDHDFAGTMRDCVRGQGEDWITDDLVRVYEVCHLQGWAHSCEVWRGDRRIGGVYGVAIGSVFCAEAMFHRETDMSKVALWALGAELRRQGFTVWDAQFATPHLLSLGGYEVHDRTYVAMLLDGRKRATEWDGWRGG